MKHFYLITAFLLILTSAYGENLQQTSWRLEKRYCTSGAIPSDAFQIGRDHLLVDFFKDKFESTTYLVGCTYTITGQFKVLNNILNLVPSHASATGELCLTDSPAAPPAESDKFSLKDANEDQELHIVTTHFQEGGTCPVGDSLISEFRRTPRPPVIF